MVVNPFNAILLFATTLLLPLTASSVLQLKYKEIQTLLLFFSSFFILSFAPYQLGFLNSYKQGIDLAGWGGVGTSSLIGPFQTAHSASVALAGSFLVVLYFWFYKVYNRLYLSVLLVLGFYFLINTYVRTGMVMVVVGALPLFFFFAKKSNVYRVRLIAVAILFFVLISNLVLTNSTLVDRITGTRKNKTETESFDELGSGRGGIWKDAVNIFLEANLLEKLIGIGETNQKQRMYIKRKTALVPHNGFLYILTSNGILGLIILLSFFFNIYKYRCGLGSNNRVFVDMFFIAYLLMSTFQNYDMYYMFLNFALIIAYSYWEAWLKYQQINERTNYMSVI